MDLEDEETWLRARIVHLRLLMQLISHSPVEAGLKALMAEMERRLSALEKRRAHPLDEDEPPGG
jgi:hypothetical protein